jgi:hypothetical protein
MIMKTKILYGLGCLFLAFAFVSCSSDDEEVSTTNLLIGSWQTTIQYGYNMAYGQILGEWTYTEDDDMFILPLYKFNEDGTGTSGFVDDETEDEYIDNSFIWSISSDSLVLFKTEDWEWTSTIKKLDNSTLILEYHEELIEDGITYDCYRLSTFRRVN